MRARPTLAEVLVVMFADEEAQADVAGSAYCPGSVQRGRCWLIARIAIGGGNAGV
jgi:hypothetical protein